MDHMVVRFTSTHTIIVKLWVQLSPSHAVLGINIRANVYQWLVAGCAVW